MQTLYTVSGRCNVAAKRTANSVTITDLRIGENGKHRYGTRMVYALLVDCYQMTTVKPILSKRSIDLKVLIDM
jgi:hypothetical protein